jgi:hypothetical protein
LRGGRRLLTERRPILLLEIFGDRLQTFSLLEELGYVCFDSDRKTVIGPETVNVVALNRELDRRMAEALNSLGYPVPPPDL